MMMQAPNDENNERRQQQQQQPHEWTPPARRRSRHLEALVLVLILVIFGLVATLVLLEHDLKIKRLARTQAAQAVLNKKKKNSQTSSSATNNNKIKTIKSFLPHTMQDLHVTASSATTANRKTATAYQKPGELYWKRAEPWLSAWDPTFQQPQPQQQQELEWEKVDSETALQSLQHAAHLGHAQAQFYAAVAYFSGIWPISTTLTTTSSSSNNKQKETTLSNNNKNNIKITTDWWSSSHHHSNNNHAQQQHTQAALWLHFAAMAGHEEAAVAMLSKTEASLSSLGGNGGGDEFTSSQYFASSSSSSLNTCQSRLLYAEAAADLILDTLQASPELGRAKVLPMGDKHVLYQLHLFGSKSSKYLEAHNQPDESLPALQFYQVRALSASSSSSDMDGGGDPQAAQAAFTLGHLHHTGLRGVSQNLTAALYWYQVAAKLGHAEAAGHSGDFWLYGIGTDDGIPNPYQAYKFYQQGTPFAIETCRRKWEQKIAKKSDGSSSSFVCDPTCLNGMGVLLLLGLPMMVTVDMAMAEKYFELAKEQGKHDAAYNLAMLKLGWKTHWRTNEEAEELEREEAEREKRDAKEDLEAKLAGKKPKHNHRPRDHAFGGMPKYSLTRSEWQAIVTDLATAAGAGHVQARHRLAKLYANGVHVQVASSPGQSATEQLTVIPPDCDKALKNFKWILDHASPSRNRRLRSAYKQYMAGDTESSLRNYLVAAETGSDLAQLNAAFLLEQGTCLGLSEINCAKAAVRLYKAAAAKGHAEASMRVGDFYYYGRFRSDLPSGPFGWLQYILYPEKYVGKLWSWFCSEYYWIYRKYYLAEEEDDEVVVAGQEGKGEGVLGKRPDEEPAHDTCAAAAAAEDDATCRRLDSSDDSTKNKENDEEHHSIQHDMERAAHYYRFAAAKTHSVRANFNLGFLYEWGLGLKQDFPLAKRHYDLALSTNSRDSELPVAIALYCLSLHEKAVKLYLSWKDWRSADSLSTSGDDVEQEHVAAIPRATESKAYGRPVPPSAPGTVGGETTREKQMQILLEHLFSLESLLILVLTVVLWILLQRRWRTQRR